jgi:hypothetical protein
VRQEARDDNDESLLLILPRKGADMLPSLTAGCER